MRPTSSEHAFTRMPTAKTARPTVRPKTVGLTAVARVPGYEYLAPHVGVGCAMSEFAFGVHHRTDTIAGDCLDVESPNSRTRGD